MSNITKYFRARARRATCYQRYKKARHPAEKRRLWTWYTMWDQLACKLMNGGAL